MDSIAVLVEKLIEASGSAQSAAKALGVSAGYLSKARQGNAHLGIEPALRLAHALNASPVAVLEAANRRDELNLITEMFGDAAPVSPAPAIAPDVLSLAMQIAKLDADEREHLQWVLARFTRGKVIPARSDGTPDADFRRPDRPGASPAGVAHRIRHPKAG